jgi:multiple antibiotic resistance protein
MRTVALSSFAILFVTAAPLKSVPVFAALTRRLSVDEQRWIAVKAVLVATVILTVFSAFGDDLLRMLGISLPAVQIGGGILLMLMAVQMVFGTPGGILEEHQTEPQRYADIAVFPIGMPLIAGPGTITAILVLMSHHRDVASQLVIYAMLLLVLLATLLLFLGVGGSGRRSAIPR